MLTVSDPFGNSLRFTEPLDQRRTGGGSRLVGLAGRTCWADRLIMRQLPATATTTRPGPAIGQEATPADALALCHEYDPASSSAALTHQDPARPTPRVPRGFFMPQQNPELREPTKAAGERQRRGAATLRRRGHPGQVAAGLGRAGPVPRRDDGTAREALRCSTCSPTRPATCTWATPRCSRWHDVIARYWFQRGYDVLHPIGWDSFGLPAENAAISATSTRRRGPTPTSRPRPSRSGATRSRFDWSRRLHTSDPEYYRWTQWLFLKFCERGLAYRKTSPGQLVPQRPDRAGQRAGRRRRAASAAAPR